MSDSEIVALVAVVVVWCGVFGWCMRASRTLIGYHASFLKTMTIMGTYADTDSDELEQEQEHAAGKCYTCKIVPLVAVIIVWCGVVGWCIRARHARGYGQRRAGPRAGAWGWRVLQPQDCCAGGHYCRVVWSVWVVHESIAYSHWFPWQRSHYYDCR